jgi:hypothetical protein
VRFGADVVEHVPLIVVMLACIALGALLGALALALPIYRMRREVVRLRGAHPAPAAVVDNAEPELSAARQSGAVVELSSGDRS